MVNHEETGIFNPVVHFSNWIYNYVVEGSGRRVLGLLGNFCPLWLLCFRKTPLLSI